MADIISQSNALVTGYKCDVYAGAALTSLKKVGFVESFNGSKQIQTQRAQVIGTIMPVSIDPQALSANLSLSGFIATKDIVSQAALGSADTTINAFCPSDEIYSSETVTKIRYVVLKNHNTDDNIAVFEWVIPTSYQVQAQGQGYLKANISMEAITMNTGSNYSEDLPTA